MRKERRQSDKGDTDKQHAESQTLSQAHSCGISTSCCEVQLRLLKQDLGPSVGRCLLPNPLVGEKLALESRGNKDEWRVVFPHVHPVIAAIGPLARACCDKRLETSCSAFSLGFSLTLFFFFPWTLPPSFTWAPSLCLLPPVCPG